METFLPHHQLTEAEGGGASYYLRTPHSYHDDDPEEEEDSVEYASVAEQEPNRNEDMCSAALVGEDIGLPLGVNSDSQQLAPQSAHPHRSTRKQEEDRVPYHLLSAPHHTPAQQWYHQYLDVRRRYL